MTMRDRRPLTNVACTSLWLFPIIQHKLEKFKMAVEEYMKARPREWRALNGFRVNHVFAKENYMEHYIVIQ